MESRPPAGLPAVRGPDTVFEHLGLAESMILVWLFYGIKSGELKKKLGFLVRMGTMLVFSPVYLGAYLRQGGSLRNGDSDYFGWLVDNLEAEREGQEYDEQLCEEIELVNAYGYNRQDDD